MPTQYSILSKQRAALFSNFRSRLCESVALSDSVCYLAWFGDRRRSQNPLLGLLWYEPHCPVMEGTHPCHFPSAVSRSHPKSALHGVCHSAPTAIRRKDCVSGAPFLQHLMGGTRFPDMTYPPLLCENKTLMMQCWSVAAESSGGGCSC